MRYERNKIFIFENVDARDTKELKRIAQERYGLNLVMNATTAFHRKGVENHQDLESFLKSFINDRLTPMQVRGLGGYLTFERCRSIKLKRPFVYKRSPNQFRAKWEERFVWVDNDTGEVVLQMAGYNSRRKVQDRMREMQRTGEYTGDATLRRIKVDLNTEEEGFATVRRRISTRNKVGKYLIFGWI